MKNQLYIIFWIILSILLFESCLKKVDNTVKVSDNTISKKQLEIVKNRNLSVDSVRCDIKEDKVLNIDYIKSSVLRFNNDSNNCLEQYLKRITAILKKNEDTLIQKKSFEMVQYLYRKSNEYSSELLEEFLVDELLLKRHIVFSKFLYTHKTSELNDALSQGISARFSVFEGKERDSIYADLEQTIKSKDKSKENDYLLKLIKNIDRELFD